MEFPGTRHEWPRRRAAEHRDEVAAFHGATPKAKDHGLSIAGLECQWVHRNKNAHRMSESGHNPN